MRKRIKFILYKNLLNEKGNYKKNNFNKMKNN